jgi:hypothetical protein
LPLIPEVYGKPADYVFLKKKIALLFLIFFSRTSLSFTKRSQAYLFYFDLKGAICFCDGLVTLSVFSVIDWRYECFILSEQWRGIIAIAV